MTVLRSGGSTLSSERLPDEVVRARIAQQLLATRSAGTATGVVRHLLAVQAQDLRAARLAVRPRSTGTTAADVDAALSAGELVVGWLQRGTLHLVAREDYWWLHGLLASRQRVANDRRLQQTGVAPDQVRLGLDTVVAAVAQGPQTRSALRAVLTAAGVPTAGQAFIHVVYAAALEGIVVRGPVKAGEQLFVDARQWVGEPEPLERDEALARLAARYLAAHAYASPRDLATWAGLPLNDARRAFAAASFPPNDAAGDRTVAGLAASVAAESVPESAPPEAPEVLLLGGFDPLVMGWSGRAWLVGEQADVITRNGMVLATVLVRGQLAGTWTMPGGRVEVTWRTDARPPQAAFESEVADVRRYLGLEP